MRYEPRRQRATLLDLSCASAPKNSISPLLRCAWTIFCLQVLPHEPRLSGAWCHEAAKPGFSQISKTLFRPSAPRCAASSWPDPFHRSFTDLLWHHLSSQMDPCVHLQYTRVAYVIGIRPSSYSPPKISNRFPASRPYMMIGRSSRSEGYSLYPLLGGPQCPPPSGRCSLRPPQSRASVRHSRPGKKGAVNC